MDFNEKVNPGTEAYAITISDKFINFQSDGNKMSVDLSFFSLYKQMINIGELKTLLKENKIIFYTYWNKKRLIALANEHNLIPKIEVEKEKKLRMLSTIY